MSRATPAEEATAQAAAHRATATHRLLSAAASTNATNVKATPGTVTRVQGHNAKASAVFLKLYDKATAPTVGTDTPRKTIRLAASSNFDHEMNDAFTLGIGYGITGAAADADTTALVAADVICLNIVYR